MKNKILKTTLILALIFTLTMANFIFVGANFISYAAEKIATNHANVEFDAYFKNEKGEWDNCFGQNFYFPIEKVEVEEEPELSLVTTPENGMSLHKGLRKSYIWSKKIKLAIYKILHYVPKIISGNYKRKINEN